MILKISNKEQLLNEFLVPLSKVADSAVLNIEPGKINALVATNDNTIIVNAVYTDSSIDCSKRLNIPDVKKLCRILQCIDKPEIQLKLDINNISYSSSETRFKYHLYDDSIIPVPKLNLSKLDKLDFNGQFTMSHSSIVSLIKGSSIATDTNKIYLTFKENEVFGELTDKARSNVDSYGLKVASDYQGSINNQALPLNFEIFRIISSMKFSAIKSKIALSTGVLTFDMNSENTQMRFIISALAN